MGRAPCCDKTKVKRGPWSPEEDTTLKNYIHRHGTGGNWIALPHKAGLQRCGKSCRLRWLNYLRPDIKHGGFTEEEDNIILTLYKNIGSRWSVIASHLQGRTDNDVKNYWNTKLKKKLLAAKAMTDMTNTSSTTNSMHLISHKPYTHCNHYANSACSGGGGGGSGTLPYGPLCVNGQQNVFAHPAPASDPIQLPLPSLTEVGEFGTSGNYGSFFHASTLVSHQEEASNSFCLGNYDQMVRPGNGGVEHGGFLIDDLLNGFDFQEKVINEVCPTLTKYSF